MTNLQFVAAIVSSLAWPLATVIALVLLRHELVRAFQRMQTIEFPGVKATFATLLDIEKVAAEAAKDAVAPGDEGVIQQEMTEFNPVAALASVAPGQAVIDAWSLLEYQLNVASDRMAPDQPHGWPQVAHTLEGWDKWPMLYPAITELRRLRDYTVRSKVAPSTADAARYVTVAQDLAAAVRTSFTFPAVTAR